MLYDAIPLFLFAGSAALGFVLNDLFITMARRPPVAQK